MTLNVTCTASAIATHVMLCSSVHITVQYIYTIASQIYIYLAIKCCTHLYDTCRILYSGKVWLGKSLANCIEHLFGKKILANYSNRPTKRFINCKY